MTQQEKKLLTVLGTVVVFVALAVLVLVPYARKLSFYQKTIETNQQQIVNLQRQVANKPALNEVLTEFDSLIEDSNLFMRVSDREAAVASLLSETKSLIEGAGGQINSINPARGNRNADNDSRAILIRVTFQVDNDGFVNILSELAGHKPLINVVQSRIVPEIKRRRREIQETGQLRISMDLEAFYSPNLQAQR